MKMFVYCLEGDSQQWYKSLPSSRIYSMKEFHATFHKHYKTIFSPESLFEDCCKHSKFKIYANYDDMMLFLIKKIILVKKILFVMNILLQKKLFLGILERFLNFFIVNAYSKMNQFKEVVPSLLMLMENFQNKLGMKHIHGFLNYYLHKNFFYNLFTMNMKTCLFQLLRREIGFIFCKILL